MSKLDKAKKTDKHEEAGTATGAVASATSGNAAADTTVASSEVVPPVVEPKKEEKEEKKEKKEKKEEKALVIDDGKIAVTVPKAFNLRLQNNVLLSIKAGSQRMAPDVFDHPYTQANGVKKV